MKYIKVKLCFTLCLSLCLKWGHAQETLPASGDNVSGTGGNVSYTVGDIYISNKGTTGSVDQGVQQPFEISVFTGIEVAKEIILTCSAYPNPTIDNLILKIEGIELEELFILLCDLSGKILENKKIENNETIISMSDLVSGTYFLKIMQTQKTGTLPEIKIFKIIKK
jgi:hypothetical protein